MTARVSRLGHAGVCGEWAISDNGEWGVTTTRQEPPGRLAVLLCTPGRAAPASVASIKLLVEPRHTPHRYYYYLLTSYYYLRTVSIGEWLAYPPKLTVELGSYVDGEAHGWALHPYGWFDPAPRPREIIHTTSVQLNISNG